MSEYRPMDEAPRDGTPIVAVCGGVEMPVAYENFPGMEGWFYFDTDDGITFEKVNPKPTMWRGMF